MTAERLEIIAGSGKILESLILTPIGDDKTILERDFLFNDKQHIDINLGIYDMKMSELKPMIKLKVRLKYGKGFEAKYKPITNHTQHEMVPE